MTDAPKLTPTRRVIRYRLEYILVASLRGVVNIVPERISRAMARGLGALIARIWGSRRRMARRNLERSYGDGLTAADVDRITRDSFKNTALSLFEVLRFPRMTREGIRGRVIGDTPQCLNEVVRQGRGAILLSGHVGNWELFGAWVRALGFPLDVVVKPMRNPYVDALFNRCRASADIGIIHTQVATRGIVRALQANRFVAILADQYAGAEGVDVAFFGRPASTPRGPAALALKFNCPILTGALTREPDGRYRAWIDEPLEPDPQAEVEGEVLRLTQEVTRRIEAHIRRAPGQWLWTHNRWHD